jgi:signal transduction histidine kinase
MAERTGVLAAGLVCFVLGTIPVSALEDAPSNHKHVLVLQSYGRDFSPYADVVTSFEIELSRLSPLPVEFFEASLESARFSGTTIETPLVDYLNSLFAEESVDLLVAVGAPASEFCLRERERLFPATPLLVAGVDQRWVSHLQEVENAAAVPVTLDPAAAIDNILRLLPGTREVMVVLGSTSLSKKWRGETEREFARFVDRVRFTWTDEWSLDEIEKRVSHLPPHSAIFFGELFVDAAGIPHPRQSALTRLRAAANAPIFGLFDVDLGRGIVGGPLLSLSESGKQAADVAAKILKDPANSRIDAPPVTMSLLEYDYRELERWEIPESRLPSGSIVSFRPPSTWSLYSRPILLGVGVVGLQTALIAGLLLQRSRRRVAEDETRALARRLLTAHEDERRRLARDLHDDLSQRLARLAIDASVVERGPASTGKQQSAARSIRDDLVRLSEDVHALSYQLHPSVLDDLGLKEALAVECDRFSRRESIRAQVTSFDAPTELRPDVSLCLFRIAQEALRNVAKHSRARDVDIQVSASNGTMRMTLSDDGVGFDPARRIQRSLGHASMRERASLVRGRLDVESAPGRGTTVTVSVPLEERA